MTIEGGAERTGLIERAKNILLSPRTEWDVIEGEPASIQSLYLNYAVILAAIPPIAGLLAALSAGSLMNSMGGIFGVSVSLSPVWAMLEAIKNYVASLIMVFVIALIIDGLAPNFGGVRNRIQALKVSTYSATAFWVAGAFVIIPILGAIVMLAACFYAAYLIYLGLQQLMQSPREQAAGYAILSIVLGILAAIVIYAVVSVPFGISKAMTGGIFGALTHRPGTVVNLPGGTRVEVDEMKRAAKQMEEAARKLEAASAGGAVSTAATASADVLQTLLPAALPGGFARSETSSGGMSGVVMEAEGTYQRGDSRIELQIADMGALGALSAMASGVTHDKRTATGYEKLSQVNGRMTTEEYNRTDNTGKYGVVVASRYMVQAEGRGVTIEDLKSAVEAVPFAQLEAMAKG